MLRSRSGTANNACDDLGVATPMTANSPHVERGAQRAGCLRSEFVEALGVDGLAVLAASFGQNVGDDA